MLRCGRFESELHPTLTPNTDLSPQALEDRPQRRFVFLLLDKFTLLSFACAVEALRIANRMAGQELYSWRMIGEGGAEAVSSNGATFRLDGDLEELARDDMLMVCGGLDVAQASNKKVLSWLRREARRGVTVAGICTAGWTGWCWTA